MKYFIIFLILLFYFSFSFASKDTLIVKNVINVQQDTLIINNKDSLYVILSNNAGKTIGFDWQKNMPWIGAILVGILTVLANLIISKLARKSNKETVDKQLSFSKEIALAQIENAKNNALLDFNKTVLSGNRQNWINELRELISKILSVYKAVSLKQDINRDEYEKLQFLITKIELMLNPNLDKEFINSLHRLESCFLEILMKTNQVDELKEHIDNVKSLTQITLKREWEKVKKGI